MNRRPTTGLDPFQFRAQVVEPALGKLGLPGGEAAIRLVLGTAVQESNLRKLRQDPSGPARGVFQVEPATLQDCYDNFLNFRPDLLAKVDSFLAPWPDKTAQLATNLIYAAAICRIVYRRAPDPLPAADDLDGLGKYWDRFYNKNDRVGTPAEFVSNYRSFIGG